MSKAFVSYFLFIWWVCERSAVAVDRDEELALGLQSYVIPMQDCAIELVAKKGGHAQAYMSSGGPYGYFSQTYWLRGESQESLRIGISCYKGAAVDLCPKLLPTEDAEYVKYYNVHSFNKWHPVYFSTAQISSRPLYTSGPGQVRSLDFCFGDNSHTLHANEGGVVLGYDSRDVSETVGKKLQKSSEVALPDALEILRSIRFISIDEK